MLRVKWLEQLPETDLGRLASRLLETVPDEDLALLTPEGLLGRTQWAMDHLKGEGPQIAVLNPDVERDGWGSAHSILAVAVPDLPFLVDSLRIEVRRFDQSIHLTQNLVLPPTDPLNPSQQAMAVVLLDIDRIQDETGRRTLRTAIAQVLNALAAAVADYPLMNEQAQRMADELQSEPAEFMRWLSQDHFTFLGYANTRDERLGVCSLKGELAQFTQAPAGTLWFDKAPFRSQIHRAAYMDRVVLTTGRGKSLVEHHFLGLYTSRVYQEFSVDIPVVREKIHHVLTTCGFTPGGHNYKQLSQILQVFPRDELLQIEAEELARQALSVLRLQERRRSRLTLRHDRVGNFATVILYVPRDRYDTELRWAVQQMLQQALQASDIEFNTTFSESVHTRVQFIVRLGAQTPTVSESELQARVEQLILSWEEGLAEALAEEHGEVEGQALLKAFGQQLPAGYREDMTPARAVLDIHHLSRLSASNPLSLSLYQDLATQSVHLKLYHWQRPIPLSDALPMMEHLGVRVLADQTYAARDRGWYIHDFTLQVGGAESTLADWRTHWQDAFAACWHGQTESDRFHGLVLSAGLSWRDIAVLRALSSYIKQIGFELSREWMAGTLVAHPALAKELIALFYARHEPGRSANLQDRVLDRLNGFIDGVAGLNEDRLMRRFRDLIMATDRVNFFQPVGPKDVVSLAFKVAPSRMDDLPKPVPMHEIFVYSARVEGVHLRGGKVARGGLRWSDRLEDYRTEVLGLVKAQQVKNAVIVPEGAKGGFVPKQLSGDRDAIQAEAIAAYQEFIRSLLSLTDNLVEQKLVPPKHTVRHDDDDPYLVVAADKGTATFSDIANQIAVDSGFWLGDAFASGGSAGYDHKKMGVTAKGAWVSVIHHFRETGRDPSVDPFTAVGIGDMSGDVFGNGMLLSDQMQLLAAFNHLHIFVDPTPDPVRSHAERQRLFALPRSGWKDYDPDMISQGGAVFDRSAKSIDLSPQAAKALGVTAGSRTPNQLIREILMAQVDLLWNGGIGTYIKGAQETHLAVGDKANDAIRIDGHQVGARILGEGGNLGVTQLGRVEMALNGVLVNTDFIDNSAGVDCSDHEVNLKILLGQRELAGELTRKQRDRLLESMTDEVSDLVLSNNDHQAGALGIAAFDSERNGFELARFVQVLSERGELDPELEGLPSDIAARQAQGQPLTRPELAVLMSTAKNRLKRGLIGLEQDAAVAVVAADAFPASLRQAYALEIQAHRLRPQLVATQMANAMVHYLGIAVAHRLEQLSGTGAIGVAKAFQVARLCFELDRRWEQLEALPASVPVDLRRELLLRMSTIIRRVTRWILRRHGGEIDVRTLVDRYQSGMSELTLGLPKWLSGAPLEHFDRYRQTWIEQGVPEDLAAYLASAPSLTTGPAVIEAALETGQSIKAVTGLYLAVGEHLGFQRFASCVNGLSVTSSWEARARDGFRDDLDRAYHALASKISVGRKSPDAQVQAWMAERPHTMDQWQELVQAAAEAGNRAYPVMTVAGRELGLLPDATR